MLNIEIQFIQQIYFMINKWLLKVEFAYYAILPFLGYIAVYQLNSNTQGVNWLPFMGWVVLLVYQIVYLGLMKSAETERYTGVTLIIPPFLIGLNQSLMNGTIWDFFLEQTMMEVVALMIGLSVIFMFFKNDVGRYAYQDIGIIPLMVVGFLFFGVWGIVTSWWNRQSYTSTAEIWNIAIFAIAFLIELRTNIIVLNKIVKRKLIINDVYQEVSSGNKNMGFFIIFGQMILWILVIPLLYFFFG